MAHIGCVARRFNRLCRPNMAPAEATPEGD
jgi:hypothetical protein